MPATLEAALHALGAAGLVVYPTESFYGLGASACDAAAVDRLMAVRGREAGKPILVLVDGLEMAAQVVRDVPAAARRLGERFWPGPLTLVLPARADVPAPLTAGTGTIGVRVSGNALATELVRRHGRPMTAPSANPPGAPPPRRCEDARAYFGARVTCYVEGGTLPGGASTVAAVEGEAVRVLRAGPVSEEAMQAVLKEE